MAPSREIRGRPAAPGIALGPLVRLGAAIGGPRSAGDPTHERLALEQAIAGAIGDLEALQARTAGSDEATMLDFQIEMLRDDALREPALDAIAGGVAAETAWTAALRGQITDYEAAD